MKQKNSKYDVIIVGAGSSGLTAAKFLAFGGKKTLILEKNKVVGDKVCAGGLTVKDLKEFKIPESVREIGFEHVNLHFGKNVKRLELTKSWIWTCSRRKLGEWQLKEAKKQGAEILLNAKVAKIRKNSVLLNDGREFSFKYLIGADGSNSIIRKFLGIDTKKTLLAMQYLIPHGKFKELEIFINVDKFGPHYAWIFPHEKFDSIGAGADPKFIPAKTIRRNFDDWCKTFNIDVKKYKLRSAAINYDYKGVEFGNVFLIGDAAGLASGFTGEGIHPGMVAGREVAQRIIDPEYDLKGLKEIIKYKNFEENLLDSYKISKVLTKGIFNIVEFLLKGETIKKETIKFLTNK